MQEVVYLASSSKDEKTNVMVGSEDRQVLVLTAKEHRLHNYALLQSEEGRT